MRFDEMGQCETHIKKGISKVRRSKKDICYIIVSGHHSDDFNILYNTGLLGIMLFIAFIATPLFLVFQRKAVETNQTSVFWLLAAYLSYLVVFAIHTEELSMMFSVVYALLVFSVTRHLPFVGRER